MNLRIASLIAAAVLFSTSVSNADDDTRTGKRFGFFVGVISEPFPSILSVNVAVNVLDSVRLTAGTGTVGFGSTTGVSLKHLFSPSSSLSPVTGIGVARTRIVDFLSGAFGLKPSPDDIFWTSTISAGLDWQSQIGFNLGLGANFMWLSSPSDTLGTKIFPYLNVGWFF